MKPCHCPCSIHRHPLLGQAICFSCLILTEGYGRASSCPPSANLPSTLTQTTHAYLKSRKQASLPQEVNQPPTPNVVACAPPPDGLGFPLPSFTFIFFVFPPSIEPLRAHTESAFFTQFSAHGLTSGEHELQLPKVPLS